MNLLTGANPIASWWLAIVVVAVLTVVVAILLYRIVKTAGAINEEVATVWANGQRVANNTIHICLLYTSPSPRDATLSRMPSSA